MNKIFLIISREYLTRVRKKSFIVMTIVGPLLFAALMVLPTWLATRGSDQKVIEVLDESGNFKGKFQDSESFAFTYISDDLESAKGRVPGSKSAGLLYIPKLDVDNPQGIVFYSPSNPSMTTVRSIERTIKNEIEEIKLLKSGIDKETLASLKSSVSVNTINLSATGEEKESSSAAASIAGYASSLLIYFFIFLYGAQIMRGVIEEKTNRILEVIISSVKPFQLMVGKIVGVAAVGLTQFVLWILLTFAVATAVTSIFGIESSSSQAEMMAAAGEQGASPNEIASIMASVKSINFPLLLATFLFYFLGGYLLYGALFAAVGSAVDSDADSQQFMFPITIPLILSIMVLGAVLNEPDGTLAFWMSMIPFTSPIVMMMRVPFGVPAWQLALSMVLLVGGFLFTSWVAGRIYRIGVLMHGTKVNYKVLAKWFAMKN